MAIDPPVRGFYTFVKPLPNKAAGHEQKRQSVQPAGQMIAGNVMLCLFVGAGRSMPPTRLGFDGICCCHFVGRISSG